MTYGYTDASVGDFYQDKPSLNINTVINYFLTKPVTFHPTAIIQQEVKFPDVSFYQGEINYSVMRLQTDTIIIRIGQNLWADDEFENNYLEAKKQGMRVGGYFFYDDRISPREQAELLVTLCQSKTFELEIYIDWENSYGGEFKGLKNVVAMMELVEMALQMNIFRAKGVGMYTGYFWFRANSNPVTHVSQYNYLKTRPLWLAWYTNQASNVFIPAPWAEMTLWQFGTPVVAWGQATKEIDMNFFNGTKQDFEIRYGETTEPEPEEPPMSDYIRLTPSVDGEYRSIRRPTAYPQVPHIAGASFSRLEANQEIRLPITDAPYVYAGPIRYTIGTTVYEAFAGDKWWKVNINEEDGWIAEIHKGVKYLNVQTVREEDPIPAPQHVVEVVIDGVVVFRTELP